MFQNAAIVLRCLAAMFLCGSLPVAGALFSTKTDYIVGNSPRGIWLGNLRNLGGTTRDLVVANYTDNTVSVRLCLDDGTFGGESVYSVGLNPTAIITGDFNHDGFGDIAVADSGTNRVSVLINTGFGMNFLPAGNYVVGTNANPGPCAVAVADVNRDGKLDLVVANFNENSVSVLLGSGGGAFGSLTNYDVGVGPGSIYVGDLDQDGVADILTADRTSGTLTILHGATNGTFGNPQTITLFPDGDPQPVAALGRDFDGDGLTDIAVVNIASNSVSILPQDEFGDFAVTDSYDTGSSPQGLLVRDLNRDGIADLVVANSGDGNVQVLLGASDGSFASAGTFGAGSGPVAVGGSNFNNDNATDLAVANSGGNTVSVLLYAAPLADDTRVNVNEDTNAPVILRGRILDGSPLTYVILDCPTNGTLNTDCPTNGYLTNLVYTPDPDFFGTDTFRYQSTDGSLTSVVATVTLNVLPVNDAPRFDLSTKVVTVLQDAFVTNIVDFATNIVSGPANEAGQLLSFVSTTTNQSFFAMKPRISPLGALRFRPALNATGAVTVSVYLRDNGGKLRGGVNTSTTQAFDVVVLPHPLKPVKGTYNGLFFDTLGAKHESSGFITFTMAANGRFTGRLIGDGGAYRMNGQFDLTGHAHTEVLRNTSTLGVDLYLDLTGDSDTVTGLVTNSLWASEFHGDRVVFSTLNPAPQAGKYTMTIPGGTDAALSPGGAGYGTLKVASNGQVRASGKLSDGSTFSQTTTLSKTGQWPFYGLLYNTRGSILSWITFTNLVTNGFNGVADWFKPAIVGRYYPGGFTNESMISGSTYTSPPVTVRVLALTDCNLILSDGNLSSNLTAAAIMDSNSVVTVGGTTILRRTSALGLMSGSFIDPAAHAVRALRGVVLQQENTVRGYFLGTNQSGSLLLQAP